MEEKLFLSTNYLLRHIFEDVGKYSKDKIHPKPSQKAALRVRHIHIFGISIPIIKENI